MKQEKTRNPEFGIVVLGFAAACLSLAFALIMTSKELVAPRISGSEYLAIFTRPAENRPDQAGVSRNAHNLTAGNRKPEINLADDELTVGSIPQTGPAAQNRQSPMVRIPGFPVRNGASSDAIAATLPQNIIPDYRIRGVFGEKALLVGPSGFVMVETGSRIENAGTLKSILRIKGKWRIVTDKGMILDNLD